MSESDVVTGPHTEVPSVRPRHIGSRVTRAEDPRLLSGRGHFLADIVRPRELHVAFVRSPMAHARITAVKTDVAKALAGVHTVRTGAEIAELCDGMEGTFAVDGCSPTNMPLLANSHVRYPGEAVVAVVAESRTIAEDACDLIDVEYDVLDAVIDPMASLAGEPLANNTLDHNTTLQGQVAYGDVDRAFGDAHQIVRSTYHTGRVSPAPLEGRGCLAEYSWADDELKLWTGSQVPQLVGYLVSLYGGFAENRVEVITPDTGGGFGQKAHVHPEEVLVSLLAKELDRPVKWVEDRRENLMSGIHAHEQIVELSYALDKDGRITGQRMRALGDGGAYHSVPWSMAVEPWCTAAINPIGIYDIPAFENDYLAVATNKTPIGAYRGVGYMTGSFVHEVLADEAARKLGISPFEFRRRNVVKSFPYTNVAGVTYDEGSWAESIDELERLIDVGSFRERQARMRDEGRYLGLGVSIFVESTGESTATSQAHGLNDTYFDSATVKMEPQGTVTVTTGLPTQGQGNRITMAQVAADVLGVAVEDVTVRCGESNKYTWGGGTLGSRAAVIASGAIVRSADVIRTKLKQVAAGMLEVAEWDIELVDGEARVAGVAGKKVSVADIATSIYFDNSTYPKGFDPSLEVTMNYDPTRPVFSNGAHAFIVEVDVETGLISAERAFSVEDCGTMINPAVVEGQIRGGMTQGLGCAVLEELVYEESGQLVTTTLADYLMPTSDVVPRFEFKHLETPSKFTAGGVKGMGESGLIASPGAVVNAVNDALAPLGAVLRRTPMTPERVLEAIENAQA